MPAMTSDRAAKVGRAVPKPGEPEPKKVGRAVPARRSSAVAQKIFAKMTDFRLYVSGAPQTRLGALDYYIRNCRFFVQIPRERALSTSPPGPLSIRWRGGT